MTRRKLAGSANRVRTEEIVHEPAPSYPLASQSDREAGRVVVRVLIDRQGRARNVVLQRSSGFERLDVAALEAVRSWHFDTATYGRTTETAWVLVPMNFMAD